MSQRKEQIKAELDSARRYLDDVLDRVGNHWDSQVYSDGLQWTVRAIAAHLVDAERGHYNQATNIAEGNDIIPEDFDIERYNASRTRKNADKTPEQARAELAASHQELIDWLDALDENKLDQMGRHASLQILSVEDILRWKAMHERLHAGDIAKALGIEVQQ